MQTYSEYFNLGEPYTVSTEYNGYGEPLSSLKDKDNTYTEYGTPIRKDAENTIEITTYTVSDVNYEVPEMVGYIDADITVELPPVTEEQPVFEDPLMEKEESDLTEVVHTDEEETNTVLEEVSEVDKAEEHIAESPVETSTVIEEVNPEVVEKPAIKKPRVKRGTASKKVNKTKVNK